MFPRHTPLIAIVENGFPSEASVDKSHPNPVPKRHGVRDRTDFSPRIFLCAITRADWARTILDPGCSHPNGKGRKATESALGSRQVGRQADIELYISISWYLRGNIRGRARYFMGLVNIAGRRELAGKAAAFSFALLLHPSLPVSPFPTILDLLFLSIFPMPACLPSSGPET